MLFVGAANVMSGEHRSYWNLVKTYFGTKNFNPLNIIGKNRAICGYHLGHLIDQPQLFHSALEAILDLYRQGKIKPQIDSVWSFDDVSIMLGSKWGKRSAGMPLSLQFPLSTRPSPPLPFPPLPSPPCPSLPLRRPPEIQLGVWGAV